MRAKVIAGNLIAVLLLGLASYLMVRGELTSDLARRVSGRLDDDQRIVDRALRLNALEFLLLVQERAASADVRNVFAALDEEGRRTRAFDAAERSSGWFADPARGMMGSPDIVLIVNDAGKVIARNVDRNRMYGNQLSQELPSVRATLSDGRARHDVWDAKDDGKMLHYAVASVVGSEGVILGALVVGYDLSNGLAKQEGGLLDRDVAFVVEGKVYSSSFSESNAKQLRSYLFGPEAAATKAALGGAVTPPFRTTIDGETFVGVMAPLPMSPSAEVAYAVLANQTEALALAKSAPKIILILMILFSLVVVVYGFMVAVSYLKPMERIEEDVLAIINGDTERRLDTSSNSELGGLAYRINQLVNVFTGVSEGDTAPSGAGWTDSTFADGSGVAGGNARAGAGAGPATDAIDDPALAQRLEAEPAAEYYSRLFREYVAAKQSLGENVGSIPEDRFIKRLQGNEAALAKKHGCRMVRFQVNNAGNQGALQPVLIR